MTHLLDDPAVAQRILDHIDHETTDLARSVWREPVANYQSEARLEAEIQLLRARATLFCPSAALPEAGSYVARVAAGTSILVVRGQDQRVRAFRNACRHRGVELAQGSGCEKSLVCPYHGWTYRLDGRLRHVPHAHGFPGLDRDTRGLVPLAAAEHHGLVFVSQHDPTADGFLVGDDTLSAPDPWIDELAGLVTEEHRLVAATESVLPVNWKILAESFLEGYHIRTTHRETFYPLQFDNLNVVETFGPNSRIAYPYRNIGKLRAVPPADRRVGDALTYLYHLFPNGIVATFPDQIIVVALEPVAVDRTRQVSYVLIPGTDPRRASVTAASSGLADGTGGDGIGGHGGEGRTADGRGAARPGDGVSLVQAGTAEDNAMVEAVQRGLASGANEYFEFGRFEAALGHFHRTLDAALGQEA